MGTDKDQLQAPSTESVEAGYETSGVSIKGLLWFVIGLIVTAVVVHVGMWFLLSAADHATRAHLDRPTSVLMDKKFNDDYEKRTGIKVDVAQLPPSPPPRIQPSPGDERIPSADLQLMYEQEDDLFRRMGWDIDESTHAQTQIPPDVVKAVIQDEMNRRPRPQRPRGPRTGAGQTRTR